MRTARGVTQGSRKTDKWMRDALLLSINDADPKTGLKKRRKIADAMVDAAMDGNVQAFVAIRDTVDGKPTQDNNHTVDGSLAVTFEQVIIDAADKGDDG